MSVQLVVFDIAGTTVYDNDAIRSCFRATLADAELSAAPEVINAVMGLPKPEAIRRLAGPGVPPERIAAIHEDFVARMKRHYQVDPSVREADGASATFGRLRAAGVKVALDTGFSRPIVDVLLARLRWREGDAIDASVCSDEVPRGRPHPDMILHLMRKLGIDSASSVAKVGDTPVDLQQGTAAGCAWVVGVTSGTHTREQLARHPHTHLIDNLSKLPELLGLGE
jgi:phosphonatase-like hydrolase